MSVEDTGTAALQQEVRLAGLVFVCSAHMARATGLLRGERLFRDVPMYRPMYFVPDEESLGYS